jgi:hypothetical protein
MRIEIQRDIFNAGSTLGRMFIDGVEFGYTLEDKDRGLTDKMSATEIKLRKIFGQTAIPYGEYEVVLSYSNRFKKIMPLLLNVKGFEGVRIHGGNTDADTLGCPLLGATRTDKSIFECADKNRELIVLIDRALKFDKVFLSITKA